MIKKRWKMMILTSLVLLVPVVVGLLLWNQLPEQLPSHWDINGNVDGWSEKTVAVFGFPGLLLGLHWICALAASTDPKQSRYHIKSVVLILWLCPVLGLVLSTLMYSSALNLSLKIEVIMPLLMGLLFLVVGNLLPKCPQTYTVGIRLPWTLASEENWNKTHRFGGKIWVIGGLFIMATAFLGMFWILLVVLAVMAAAPTIYSYCYYRKHEKHTDC